jgi:SAM-dependent methyltransferase
MTAADFTDTRSEERLRAHYELEVELANRLREAPKEERLGLYGRVYDELFERVPDHPQLVRRAEPAEQAAYARSQVELIRRFLPVGGGYVEIGAGDCATVRGVAAFSGRATAVEVSADIVPTDLPDNVTVAISDGVSVPVEPGSADVVYSNQLMEHLHPDDALEQLQNIVSSLRPGGRYICITPNRLTGPHDISSLFDLEPRGFHLAEYTYGELIPAFKRSGFRRVRVLERIPARLARLGSGAAAVPAFPYLAVERVARVLPRSVVRRTLMRRLLGINIVAER